MPALPQFETAQRLGAVITAAADGMFALGQSAGDPGHVSVAPLRQLQAECERYLSVTTAPTDKFLLFFLALFLQDIFYNLTGDIAYFPNSEARRQQFFAELGAELKLLGQAVFSNQFIASQVACEKAVGCYLNAILEINNLQAQE